MPNYEHAVIYKICCKDPEVKEIYVGSTCDLRQRKYKHANNCTNESRKEHHYYVYQRIRDHGGWDNWEVIQIEEFPCNSKRELEARERHWLETLGSSLNKNTPCQTIEERREYDLGWHREKRADPEYREERNERDRERRRENKVTCEHCGSVVSKDYLKKHQQTKKCLAYQ